MEEHLFNLSFVVSSLYWSLEPLRPPWWRQVVKQIETIHFSGSNCAPFWIQRGRNKWNVNHSFLNGQTYKHAFSKNVKEIPAARRTCLERVAWPQPKKEWVETTLHWIKAASCFPAGNLLLSHKNHAVTLWSTFSTTIKPQNLLSNQGAMSYNAFDKGKYI